MIYKTHVMFAESILFSPFILEKMNIITHTQNIWNNYEPYELGIFMLILAISALLPDLDEKEAWLSRKIPIISEITGMLNHRGLTHYLITPVILYFLILHIIPSTQIIILQIVISGWTLHIFGDALTKSAIPNGFFPFKINFALLPKAFRFRTYGLFERKILLPTLTALFIYEIYILIYINYFN